VLDRAVAANPAAAVYFSAYHKRWIQLTYSVRSQGNGARISPAFVDAIRHAVREAAPTTPVLDITPLATNIDQALAPQRFTTGLLTGFAAVALLLASVGLYGAISFSVQQRTSEV